MEKNFKSGKLKKVTIKKVLKTSPYANDMDGMSDEELLAAYIDYKSCFIDDDGESHGTEEPYMVNGAAFCCGAELAFDDETSTYVCEVCGAEYDDEDEE